MATVATLASVTATATTTTEATRTRTLASAPLYPHTPDTGAPTDALAEQGDKGSRFRADKAKKENSGDGHQGESAGAWDGKKTNPSGSRVQRNLHRREMYLWQLETFTMK